MAKHEKTKLVTGLFKSRSAAEAAMDALMARGYKRDDITVMMSDATRSKEFALESGSKAAKGAGIGGAVGGSVGAALAAIAAIGTSLAIPGLGLVVAGRSTSTPTPRTCSRASRRTFPETTCARGLPRSSR